MKKEEIADLAKTNWNEINRQYPNGLNPYAHMVGFMEGFKKHNELTTPPPQSVSAEEILNKKESESHCAFVSKERIIILSAMEEYRNIPVKFTPEITAQEESDSELNEAVSIIETLMQYGNIRPIEGVVYPAGTHKEFLHKANEWLHRNRSKVLTILKGM